MAIIFISFVISSIIYTFLKSNTSGIDSEIKSIKRKKMLSLGKENLDNSKTGEIDKSLEILEEKLKTLKSENKKKFVKIFVITTPILFILSYIGQNASR